MAGLMSKVDHKESQPSAPIQLYDPPPSYSFSEHRPRLNTEIQAGSSNHSMQQQYEPPPSYEESLNHPTISQYFNEATGVNSVKPTHQVKENSRLPNQEKPPVPASYPKQNYPFGYQQQHQVNFAIGAAPGVSVPFLPPFYPGQQVIIPNAFDEGVRFSPISPPSIPPPPPGIAPNVAQLAAQHGAQVVTSKKKSSLLTGGKGAGFTFW